MSLWKTKGFWYKTIILFIVALTVVIFNFVLLKEKESLNWLFWLIDGALFCIVVIFYLSDKIDDSFVRWIDRLLENKSSIWVYIFIFIFLFHAILLNKILPEENQFNESEQGILTSQLLYLIAIMSIILSVRKEFKYKKYTDKKEKELNQVLSNINEVFEKLVKFNPIYSSQDTFKGSIDNLRKISSSKVALEFSIESLNQMGKIGFLQIDVPFSQYSENLLELVASSKNSVMGSFTYRPKHIYNEIMNPARESEVKMHYLDAITEKELNKKIRVVILSTKEIIEILSDSIVEMLDTEEADLLEIPEIFWFNTNISDGFKTYWITDILFKKYLETKGYSEINKLTVLPTGAISDFAVFDNEFLVSWRNEFKDFDGIEKSGTMLVSWNTIIKNFMNSINILPTDAATFHFHHSFSEMVKKEGCDNEKIKELLNTIDTKRQAGFKWKNNYINVD